MRWGLDFLRDDEGIPGRFMAYMTFKVKTGSVRVTVFNWKKNSVVCNDILYQVTATLTKKDPSIKNYFHSGRVLVENNCLFW